MVKRLPKHNGEFEYQIKSVSEIDERIVRESQSKPFRGETKPDDPIAHSAGSARKTDLCNALLACWRMGGSVMKAVIERLGEPLFSIFTALKVPHGFGCPPKSIER